MRFDDGVFLMSKLVALDLFCGAGGTTRGLQDAGFHVTGIDLVRSPRYCGDEFARSDALRYLRWVIEQGVLFDFIWASPPCQAHSALKTMHNALPHVDLIGATRELLIETGLPWAIENVVGAPLRDPFMLCGTMFGLGTEDGSELRRHRIFETNFPVRPRTCSHNGNGVIGIYGGHYRNRQRKSGRNREAPDFTADDGRTAMQIDWMTGGEISQAIPPAYSRWITEQWLAQRDVRVAA